MSEVIPISKFNRGDRVIYAGTHKAFHGPCTVIAKRREEHKNYGNSWKYFLELSCDNIGFQTNIQTLEWVREAHISS